MPAPIEKVFHFLDRKKAEGEYMERIQKQKRR